MLELDKPVEIGVRPLFARQLDIATQAQPTRPLCPAIGRFHQTRATAGHDDETGARQRLAHLLGERIVSMMLVEARGPEDGDAGSLEIEALEATQKLEEYCDHTLEIFLAMAFATQEGLLGPFDLAEKGEVRLRIAMLGHVGSLRATRAVTTDSEPPPGDRQPVLSLTRAPRRPAQAYEGRRPKPPRLPPWARRFAWPLPRLPDGRR